MADNVLVTRGLCKRYGATMAVDHVDLRVEHGQIYGLVGKNGAGKTTLMRMITSQSRPSGGEIELFGASDPRSLGRMRERMGAVIETPSFYPFLTAEQNLEYYRLQRGIAGKDCVKEALRLVGLGDTRNKKFKQFSLGMKQRLGLALAILGSPDLLLLDEPINGLDPMGIVQFRDLLLRLNAERQITILISSHILSEIANLATHYGFIDGGRMLQQIAARDIEECCRECLELTVDDAPKAAVSLESRLYCTSYEILPENRIRIYAFLEDPVKVTAALTEDGVRVHTINTRGTNLEDYFLRLLERSRPDGTERRYA